MRRLLTVVTAATLFAGTAFAQTAQPVLTGQTGTAPASSTSGDAADALAQFPNQQTGIFNNPLLIAGVITAAIAIPIAIAVSNNDTDATSSP